VQQRIKLTVQL